MQNEALVRHKRNPILLPNESNWWESKAVFNCAVLREDNRIHMLYRAVGEYEKYISRIGYASNTDGYCFDKRKEIAIAPSKEYEKYGIEDPRLVKIDHQTFLSYVVLSDYVSQRPSASTALATTTDFDNYTRLGIITSKGSDNKDVVLFPENISDGTQNLRYLFLHRPSTWVGSKYGVQRPSIWIGEGTSLTNFEKHTLLIKPEQQWEMLKVGTGPPPIKTKQGWLLIYHGVDKDHIYAAGAALLDLNEPTRVIARTKRPILEPKEPYEKNGDVNNVVFPTTAYVMDGKLFVYYGAADKVCCLATVDLENFLDYVLKD